MHFESRFPAENVTVWIIRYFPKEPVLKIPNLVIEKPVLLESKLWNGTIDCMSGDNVILNLVTAMFPAVQISTDTFDYDYEKVIIESEMIKSKIFLWGTRKDKLINQYR